MSPLDPSDPSSGLLATWTAPGDDFADGAVAGYKFVYSEDTGDLLDVDRSKPGDFLLLFPLGFFLSYFCPGNSFTEFSSFKIIKKSRFPEYKVADVLKRPDASGTQVKNKNPQKYSKLIKTNKIKHILFFPWPQTSHQFRFPHYDRHLYVAVVAHDDAGNEGRVSNLARVFLDSSLLPPGTVVDGGLTEGGNPSQRPISAGEGGAGGGSKLFGCFETPSKNLKYCLQLWRRKNI